MPPSHASFPALASAAATASVVPSTPAAIAAVSAVGTALLVVLCASQLPALRQVYLRQLPIEKLSFLPTLGQLANFATWTSYGLFGAHNPTVVGVNCMGLGFSALYVGLFLWLSAAPGRALILQRLGLLTLVFFPLEAGIIVGLTDAAARQGALAYVAIACNVVMYASPVFQIRSALTLMDAAAIPLLLTLSSLGCSTCWGLYGLMISDYNITAPNAAGALLCGAQLAAALYIMYRTRQDPELTRRLARQRSSDDDADVESHVKVGNDESRFGLLRVDPSGGVQ